MAQHSTATTVLEEGQVDDKENAGGKDPMFPAAKARANVARTRAAKICRMAHVTRCYKRWIDHRDMHMFGGNTPVAHL